MKINMKEWIASILGSEKRIAIPVMTHSGIELLGHTVYDAVTNGEIHARAVKLLAEKYPSAASSVIMDLTVEAEAFGAEIHYWSISLEFGGSGEIANSFIGEWKSTGVY